MVSRALPGPTEVVGASRATAELTTRVGRQPIVQVDSRASSGRVRGCARMGLIVERGDTETTGQPNYLPSLSDALPAGRSAGRRRPGGLRSSDDDDAARDRAPSDVSATPAALEHADAVELLGLVAQLEHVAFARLAADSALAPTIEQRLELSRFAAGAVERRDRVLARITEIGGDPVAAVRQYDDVLDDFDARTQPSTWWERLLKAYVGYGVADDFCRLAAEGLDEGSRAVVLEVLDDASHAELAVAELDAAGSADGVLTARLALWGRRLVGRGARRGAAAARAAAGAGPAASPWVRRATGRGSAAIAGTRRPSSSASSPPSTRVGWAGSA